MEYIFLTVDRKLYINNLIRNKILPNLTITEFDNIIVMLNFIIEYISIRFAIHKDNFPSFWHQLTQNNNRDIIAIFNLLLPYIDDKEGTFELHKKIFSLKDISTKKDPSVENNEDLSINKYLISNVQYNLYMGKEVEYSIDYIYYNFSLLLETIDRISNKLFINWLNIVPLTLNNYTKSNLFNNSIQLMYDNGESIKIDNIFINSKLILTSDLKLPRSYFTANHKLGNSNRQTLENIFNFYDKDNKILLQENLIQNKGIAIGDIFNTIYYDLFYDILHIKWLIYQYTFDDGDIDEIFIKKFNEDIAIPGLYLNIKWDELLVEQQILFISRWNQFKNKVSLSSGFKNNLGYFNLLYNIIIFMERNYDKFNSIIYLHKYKKITRYTEFDIIDNDDVNDYEDEIELTADELIERIKKIPIEDIYTYLLETIQKFMLTWYGKNIILNSYNLKDGIKLNGLSEYKFNYNSYFNNKYDIKKDNLHRFRSDEQINLPEDLTIKYKFIYNFAKAFVLIYDKNKKNDKEQSLYMRPTCYNLRQHDRIKMIELLNLSYFEAINIKTDDIDRLNIMSFASYYKRTYSNTTKKFNNRSLFEINKIKKSNQNNINLGTYIGNQFYQHIRDKIVDITFECHIMKGLLSELIFNKNLTDKVMLGNSYDEFKKNQYMNLQKYVLTDQAIDEYKKYAYYFLTDKTYDNLNEIHRSSKKNYFELTDKLF